MMPRFSVLLFSGTLILTAGLLFSVQPMIGKMILPLLGGSASVWNTAMVFFQLSLLAGYSLAFVSSRFLNPRGQAIAYVLFMAAFLLVLPFAIDPDLSDADLAHPALWQMTAMAAAVGGPFVAIAAAAPILQHWFATTRHKDAHDPYFLYAASNIGSLGALLAYPFVIERLWTLEEQGAIWMYAYGCAALLIGLCAVFAGKRSRDDAAYAPAADVPAPVSWGRRGLWLLLAFVPSSLILGVTGYITTDIASTPLLWIVPLALYLLTFILAFSRREWLPFRRVLTAQRVVFVVLMAQLVGLSLGAFFLIGLHLVLFFLCALVCHKNLVHLRPDKAHLTEFYFIMSLGGALGGVFNALIAPVVFILPVEYIVVLVLACLLSVDLRTFKLSDYAIHFRDTMSWTPFLYYFSFICGAYALAPYSQLIPQFMTFLIVIFMMVMAGRPLLFTAAFALCVSLYPMGYITPKAFNGDLIYQGRNFYGTSRVFHTTNNLNVLLHGTTIHGSQSTVPLYKTIPLTYYSLEGALFDPMEYLYARGQMGRMAVIGLGTGSAACMAPQGTVVDFYDIDPAIVEIAENPEYFSYLKDCMVDYNIILGDGRQRISGQADGLYDLIMVDSFSSDNIPIHMVTYEAVQIYLSKLKPGGVLVLHISNKYLNLEPVLARIAAESGAIGLSKLSDDGKLKDSDLTYSNVHAFIITYNKEAAGHLRREKQWLYGALQADVKLWTDQYSNILDVLGKHSLSRTLAAAQNVQEHEKDVPVDP